MTIHREGRKPLFITLIILLAINIPVQLLVNIELIHHLVLGASVIVYLLILQFFRNPDRTVPLNPKHIIAPADGKVVVIKETQEGEYFKDRRIQVSIFMSPLNVHVNRYPLGGEVVFSKYHPGKYLVAWHPKSSTLNERTTVVVSNETIGPVLFRQIAGAVARRIVLYAKKGMKAKQGAEFGFIKFGSRVDVFLPLHAKVLVKHEQKVRGGETVLAAIETDDS